MIAALAQYVAALMVLAGSGLVLVAGLGVARLPGTAGRARALAKPGVAGACLLFGAVAVGGFELSLGARALVGIGAVMFATPLVIHLVLRVSPAKGRETGDSTGAAAGNAEIQSHS